MELQPVVTNPKNYNASQSTIWPVLQLKNL